MKSIWALLVFITLGFSNGATAQSKHVALFKNITGDLKIIRNQSELVPQVGTQIFKSDVVISGEHSTGGIAFKDGTLLTVGPSSEITISEYAFEPEKAHYDFSVYLKKGSAIYSSGKLGKLSPESVKVNTPKTTVGVRGTRFIVKAD